MIIKRSGNKKTIKITLMLVVIIVSDMKVRSEWKIKRSRKITMWMDMALISLTEFGTCCAIKDAVGKRLIPQNSMSIKNPIHQNFSPN